MKRLVIALLFPLLLSCSTSRTTIKKVPDGPPYLGIQYVEAVEGVMVVRVYPDSPAEKAEIGNGDIIYELDGRKILGTFLLKSRIQSYRPGTTISLLIRKAPLYDNPITVKAVLEPLPDGFVE